MPVNKIRIVQVEAFAREPGSAPGAFGTMRTSKLRMQEG
jgi:hypothetical protein